MLVFLLLVSSRINAQVPSPPPAQTVPAFEFSRFDKTAFTNKDLATNKPLFFFFFDYTCDHCQHAMTFLNQNFNEYKKAAVYLISLDNQQMMNAFLHKYAPNVINQKNVTILQDTKNQFIVRFKPRKYPSLFLYDANKKLLYYDDNPDNMFRFTKLLSTAAK
ncbi:MAG TPA: redoxin domain-containing protein [Parafilimonas sp.]|nr:redoxin domain-containing protein [Parafilimonas sp.]